MRYIFKSNGNYFGFIVNGNLFSRDGDYLGWVEGNTLWGKSGDYRGEIFQDYYIIRNTFKVAPVPRAPKANPATPAIPAPPANRPPITLPVGSEDAF